MGSLQFSQAEAVNQAIAGVVTLGTVFVGGWLAIRGGISQLRHERLLDRRLALLEQLCEKLDDYGIALRVLLRHEDEATSAGSLGQQLADSALKYATDAGRAVQTAGERARLYGDNTILSLGQRVWNAQIGSYMLTWSKTASSEERIVRQQKLMSYIGALDVLATEARNTLRADLGLRPLPSSPSQESLADASRVV